MRLARLSVRSTTGGSVRQRREGRRRHRASGLPRGGALGGAALRHRGRARDARAHDVHLAQDRRAGAARLSDSPHSCRLARAAAVLRDLGGGDVRPDGPLARSRRGLLCRLCGGAERVRGRRAEIRRQRRRLLREDARRASLSQLRDRAAADRPQQARAQAERSDALCRRGQGARRRHRHLGRPAGRDRRRASPTGST